MATILIVEDEPLLREMLFDHLADEGHSVVEAGNGREALEVYALARPELIISDINMPVMNGYQLLDALQARHPDVEDVPFFFLSGLTETDDQIKGLNFGIDEYLCKPVDLGILTARIELALSRQRKLEQKIADAVAASRAEQAAAASLPDTALETPADTEASSHASESGSTGLSLLESKRLRLSAKQQEDIKSINSLANLHSASLISKIGRKVNISRLSIKKEKYEALVEDIGSSKIDEEFLTEVNKLYFLSIASYLSRRNYFKERALIIPTLFEYMDNKKIRSKNIEVIDHIQRRFSISIITELVNIKNRLSTCEDILKDLSLRDQLQIVEIARPEQIKDVDLRDLRVNAISMNYAAATELNEKQIDELSSLLKKSNISLYVKEIPEGKLSNAQMTNADLLSAST